MRLFCSWWVPKSAIERAIAFIENVGSNWTQNTIENIKFTVINPLSKLSVIDANQNTSNAALGTLQSAKWLQIWQCISVFQSKKNNIRPFFSFYNGTRPHFCIIFLSLIVGTRLHHMPLGHFSLHIAGNTLQYSVSITSCHQHLMWHGQAKTFKVNLWRSCNCICQFWYLCCNCLGAVPQFY